MKVRKAVIPRRRAGDPDAARHQDGPQGDAPLVDKPVIQYIIGRR